VVKNHVPANRGEILRHKGGQDPRGHSGSVLFFYY